MASEQKVLVIGAGPSGLTTALTLVREGIPVRIVDHKHKPTTHTKASLLLPRGQEIIDALGALEPLTAKGLPLDRLSVTAFGADRGSRATEVQASAHSKPLVVGQDLFERVMVDALSAAGVEMEWASDLTQLQQTGEGVTAQLAVHRQPQEITADWVVAADGPAGISRTFTTLDFIPEPTGVAMRHVDCTLRWTTSLAADEMRLFFVAGGFGAVFPLPGGAHKILTVEPATAIPPRDPTLDEMAEALRSMADDPGVELTDERWARYSVVEEGLAPGLRDGRIVLVGDAANPGLSTWGQGLNCGIADGYDVGTALASEIGDAAPRGLLDSSIAGRLAVRAGLQSAQRAIVGQILGGGESPGGAADVDLEQILRQPFFTALD